MFHVTEHFVLSVHKASWIIGTEILIAFLFHPLNQGPRLTSIYLYWIISVSGFHFCLWEYNYISICSKGELRSIYVHCPRFNAFISQLCLVSIERRYWNISITAILCPSYFEILLLLPLYPMPQILLFLYWWWPPTSFYFLF